MYNYNAELKRVIDGDTIVLDVDLGFGIWLRDEHIRLARINCPETRTRDLEEKAKGIAAREFVQFMLLEPTNNIQLKTFKDKGKYGRYIADVFINGTNLNDLLVSEGLAEYVEY